MLAGQNIHYFNLKFLVAVVDEGGTEATWNPFLTLIVWQQIKLAGPPIFGYKKKTKEIKINKYVKRKRWCKCRKTLLF